MSHADDHFAISNLMSRYYRCHDAGDAEGMQELFRHATVVDTLGPGSRAVDTPPPPPVERRPHHQHLMTNLMVELSDDGTTARGHSYYTYFHDLQGTVGPVTSGRCEDEFAKVDGEWRFTRREWIRDLGMPYREKPAKGE